jgi:hypothetical protein
MKRTVSAGRIQSKSVTGQGAGKTRPAGRSISPAMREFKRIFPQQAALELAIITGADVRHCERCLSGHRDLGSKFQQRLLQSDVGREILIALMGDAKPRWWKGFRRHLDLADLVKAQARTQVAIEKMQREMAE